MILKNMTQFVFTNFYFLMVFRLESDIALPLSQNFEQTKSNPSAKGKMFNFCKWTMNNQMQPFHLRLIVLI